MGSDSEKKPSGYFMKINGECRPVSFADIPEITELIGKLDPESKQPEESVEPCSIKRVIFSGPATIVFWSDGTKTIVKCMDGDHFSYEMGIYAATLKKIFGESYSVFKKDVHDIVTEEIETRAAFMEKLKKKIMESETKADPEHKPDYEYGKTWSVTQ